MAKRDLRKGIFITFEGIEGCGKSTHSKLLFDFLKEAGYDVIYTREPGGTSLGEAVRKVVLNSDGINISDMAELFLFEACRAQIVKEVVAPALNKKRIVISDRFGDATVCYQGYGGRLDLKTIDTLNRISTGGIEPTLTILLDIDTLEGLRRARIKGTDRMEDKDVSYHRRVRAGYLKLAKQHPYRIKVVKVSGEIPQVQSKIRQEVEIVLRGFKRPG